MGQGKEQAKKFLKENPDIALDIENKVREVAGLVAADTEKGD